MFPRRTLKELQAIRRLEPYAKEIFVEGKSDRAALRLYLDAKKLHAKIYEVQHFEIDAALVLKRGLEDNNRGRVITLAYELESYGPSVVAVADVDFDAILSIKHACSTLLFTDYTCLEMYGFDEDILRITLTSFVGDLLEPIAQLIQEFVRILKALFIVRLLNYIQKMGMGAVQWEKSCTIKKGAVHFDFEDYVDRYLNANGRRREKQIFLNQVASWQLVLTGDPRYYINGHDFLGLLSWYIRRVTGRPVTDEIVGSAVFCAIKWTEMSGHKMFHSLQERLE